MEGTDQVEETVTVSLAPWPDGALKWYFIPRLHRAINGAALSFRGRSHQTAVCSILPR